MWYATNNFHAHISVHSHRALKLTVASSWVYAGESAKLRGQRSRVFEIGLVIYAVSIRSIAK